MLSLPQCVKMMVFGKLMSYISMVLVVEILQAYVHLQKFLFLSQDTYRQVSNIRRTLVGN